MRSCYRGLSRVYTRRNAISGNSFGKGRRAGRSLLYIAGLGWPDGLEDARSPRCISHNILISQGKLIYDDTIGDVKRSSRIDQRRGARPTSSGRKVALAALNGVVGDHLVATGNRGAPDAGGQG
jgi:hypothetical protein